MSVPATVVDPPFFITCASHVVLTVSNLRTSTDFYKDIIGLVVTDEDDGILYIPGVEEVCHHSVILKESAGKPLCEQVGYRAGTDQELDKAEHYFGKLNLKPIWVEVPGQGRTLRVVDGVGVPLELCAQMSQVPSVAFDYNDHHGGGALRFDHFQLHMADVDAAWELYAAMGFRKHQESADTRAIGLAQKRM